MGTKIGIRIKECENDNLCVVLHISPQFSEVLYKLHTWVENISE